MNIMKLLRGIIVLLMALGGLVLTSHGQTEEQRERRGPPELGRMWEQFRNMSPEERQARMEEWRGLSDEERRGRIEQMREQWAARPAPPAAPVLPEKPEKPIDQLLFRSVLTFDGRTQFSLHNPWENFTFWIAQGESRNGIEVVSYQREENTLTIRHGDDEKTLALTTSRVAVLEPEEDRRAARRAEWEARREQFRRFRESWEEAAKTSPELREIENQFRELAGEFRELRQSARGLPEDSPERQQLRLQQQEMFEEVRLLSEMAILQVRQNPAFESDDVDNMDRLVRAMMFMDAGGQRGGPPGGGRRPGGGPTR